MEKIVFEENLDVEKFQQMIGEYLYTERMPLRPEIIGLKHDVKLTERTAVFERIKGLIVDFVDRFEW